jgi:hypothetical protein
MGDIKRNKVTSAPENGEQPTVTTEETRRPAAGSFVKRESLQVHFGNVEGLKLKLLENISLGIQTLCDLMDPDGSKRKDIQKKREEVNG